MSERKQRIPELDGLRTLMIFIVSWYHIWQQSWLRPLIGSYSLDYLVRSGYVWVDGTVLLSSFLLFLPYAKAMRKGLPAPDTRDFYYRRARRILPGYYFITLAVLFIVAIPWKLYDSPQFLVKDVATHLTFTFPFFRDTYMGTPLGAASWTLAIEVQAYALFPLIARGTMKKPALTLAVLCAACFGFRFWCLWSLTDYSMVVNQLINFLDVYVIGILSALAYVRISEAREKDAASQKDRRMKYLWQALATVLFVTALFGLVQMLRIQASSWASSADNGVAGWIGRLLRIPAPISDYPVIQRNQMIYRPVYALCFAALILSAPFSLLPLRKLLGNPVTKFLGAVSMNYYLIHQTLILHLKRLSIPASVSDTPHLAGEQPWQNLYTLLSFGLSLLLAILVTYAIEKPAARLMDRLRAKKRIQD